MRLAQGFPAPKRSPHCCVQPTLSLSVAPGENSALSRKPVLSLGHTKVLANLAWATPKETETQTT